MPEGMSAPVASPSTPAAPNSPAQSGNQSAGSSPQGGKTGSQPGHSPGLESPNAQPVSPPEAREYKIDGKMVKLTQKEADEYVAMSGAAKARFHEAAQMKRELEAREQQYAKNPIQALKDYCKKAGYSAEQTRQAIEDMYANEYIKYDTMTAEQRELEELKQYKAAREEETKKREQEEYQTREKTMTQEQIQHVTNEITSALESAQLPQKNKFLVQRMAFYMHENNKNNWNAPKEMILKQVVNEHKGIVGEFLKDASFDQIVNYAGQEFVDRILKSSLEKLREGRNRIQEPFVGSASNNAPHPTGKVDMSEVNRRLRDMRSGKFVGSS